MRVESFPCLSANIPQCLLRCTRSFWSWVSCRNSYTIYYNTDWIHLFHRGILNIVANTYKKNSSWVGGNCLGMSYYFDEFEWLLGNFVNYKSVLYVDIFLIYYSKMNPYREYFEKGCFFFGIILFLGQISFTSCPEIMKNFDLSDFFC